MGICIYRHFFMKTFFKLNLNTIGGTVFEIFSTKKGSTKSSGSINLNIKELESWEAVKYGAHYFFNLFMFVMMCIAGEAGADVVVASDDRGWHREAEHCFTMWCSGRVCCEGMLLTLKLIKVFLYYS